MPDSEPTSARKLRVLMVSGSLPPMHCGVGDYTARLANALCDIPGLDLAVLTSRPASPPAPASSAPPPAPAPTRFHRIDAIDRWSVKRLPAALRAVGPRPNLVHIQFPSQGYQGPDLVAALACYARFVWRVPVLTTLHEHIEPHWGIFDAALLAASRRFVIVRPEFRKNIRPRQAWTIRGKDFRLIPNASNVPRVERTPQLVREVRERLGVGSRRLVAYFGFIQPKRGIEQLFEIADPAQHMLAIMGGRLAGHGAYFDGLASGAAASAWRDAVRFTGFLPELEVAKILAAADAVVLPFLEGVGSWSTSLHAASLQGTFVLTTSTDRRGLDPAANVYYARPSDLAELRKALVDHAGRLQSGSEAHSPSWAQIARQHHDLYLEMLGQGGSAR